MNVAAIMAILCAAPMAANAQISEITNPDLRDEYFLRVEPYTGPAYDVPTKYGSSGGQVQNRVSYFAAGDPCNSLDKIDCFGDRSCVWQIGERTKKSNSHHADMAGKASCQMVHITDRIKMKQRQKDSLMAKHGLNSEWESIECAEAFYVKDCKDLNQHSSASGGPPKCAFSCDKGCTDYDGEHPVYDFCTRESPLNEQYIDLWDQGNTFIGMFNGPSCIYKKWGVYKTGEALEALINENNPTGGQRLANAAAYAKKENGDTDWTKGIGIIEAGIFDNALRQPTIEMLQYCAEFCLAKTKEPESDCSAFSMEEISITISMMAKLPDGWNEPGYESCDCFGPPRAGSQGMGCGNGLNTYVNINNPYRDALIDQAVKADCETTIAADDKDMKREYHYDSYGEDSMSPNGLFNKFDLDRPGHVVVGEEPNGVNRHTYDDTYRFDEK